jgi:hypothetical protein
MFVVCSFLRQLRLDLAERKMAEEQLVLAYWNGTIFSFERARKHSDSVFGGPMEVAFSGIEHGPKPLHMIARLAPNDFAPSGEHQLFHVPLIYGMCYDGCTLEYRIDDVGDIELRRLQPTQSSEDWPYLHFPPLLPYVPLRLGNTRPSTYAEFAGAFPNMPEQQPSELVVAVPPPATLGISLWGKIGDADNVTLLFECDLEDRIVAASNLIS